MKSHADRWQLPVLHLAFALTGMGTALLGPIVPVISIQRGLADTQTGRLFSAQFLGAFIAAVSASALIARFGLKRSVIFAYAILAAGFGAAALASWPAMLVAVCLYGGGLGLAIPTTSLAVVEMAVGSSAAPLNLLNFSWCAGAMLAPLMATWIVARSGLAMMFAVMAGIAVVAAFGVGAAVKAGRAAGSPDVTRSVEPWHMRLALLSAVLIFLYVGTETSMAGWTPLWASRLGASPSAGAAAASCFWAGILLARLLAPLALRLVAPITVILAGLGVSGAAIAVTVALGTAPALITGVGAVGLGFGAVFPTTVAVFCDTVGPRAGRLVSLIFASGALGGATLPLAVGWAASRSGGLSTGLLLATGCVVAMFAVALAVRKWLSRLQLRFRQ